MVASFGFGIPCHNERQNIKTLVERLQGIVWRGKRAERIVVISDDSTDGTNEIILEMAKHSPVPLVLRTSPIRKGKAHADNEIIRELKGIDIVGIVCSDCLPKSGALEAILDSFDDPSVGLSAGRPVPCGPDGNLAVAISRLLWGVHHHIATAFPKSTEINVFRNIPLTVFEGSRADEADLESSLVKAGYRIIYTPAAEILTQCPLTMRDYFRQRVSVTVGHMELARRTGYKVGSLSPGLRLKAFQMARRDESHPWSVAVAGIFVEVAIYAWAWVALRYEGYSKNGIWTQSRSTKRSFKP